MAIVHNQTAHALNYIYTTAAGAGAGHIAIPAWNGIAPAPTAVAVGIAAGPDHAALLGVGGFGSLYPGIHMGNIYVTLAAGIIAINYGP